MKSLLARLSLLIAACACASVASANAFLPAEKAAQRVAADKAVLIDVREPAEWADGVAAPALLLSLSDLRGDRARWEPALRQHQGKELILYCRTGNRSGIAAEILKKEGFRVANAGGFASWRDAGLPIRKPEEAATPAPENPSKGYHSGH